ncbi:MAG: hypothetical protein QOD39_3516 [Mycobacterium sp.]|jgi:hypothetical protein|nr:hypothetical protein [Mycobacterium sp.]
MVTDLQYVAIMLYLSWCLISSLSGVLSCNQDEALGPPAN